MRLLPYTNSKDKTSKNLFLRGAGRMNQSDLRRDAYMLTDKLAEHGYDWWWHSFTGYHKETGEEKSFFIEYFIINPKLGGDEVILGQLRENQIKGKKPSYVMVKSGCWGKDARQLHTFYPISQMILQSYPILLQVGACQLSEKKISGSVAVTEEQSQNPGYMSDAGSMEWNLEINKQIAFNTGYGASSFARKINAFDMYWHAEGMKTEYRGTVTLDGEVYEIIPEKSYGYADKNWGQDFTSPWVWIGCSHIVRIGTGEVLKNTALDIGGGCPTVFGMPLNNNLLMGFFYEGEDLEYNFSKFWKLSEVTYQVEETEEELIWRILAEDSHYLIKIKVKCRKSEMILMNYESPDGRRRHRRLWSGGTGTGQMLIYDKKAGYKHLLDTLYLKNVGCEYGAYGQ